MSHCREKVFGIGSSNQRTRDKSVKEHNEAVTGAADLFEAISLYVSIGFVSGFVVGAVFVSGSIVLTVLLLNVPSVALGGSLSVSAVSEIVGLQTIAAALAALRHYRDVVQFSVLWPFLAPTLLMGFVGGYLSKLLPQHAMLGIFVIVAFASILLMLLPVRVDLQRSGPATRWAVILSSGTLIGLLGGLYGIGGGFVLVPAFTVLGVRLRAAVANALILGAGMSLFGLVAKMGFSTMPWGVAVPVIGASVIGSALGGLLAKRLPQRLLKMAVLTALLAVSVKLGVQWIHSS